jgi:transcriptional regulator with XRE-family HTH domain
MASAPDPRGPLRGHALRNEHLRLRAIERAAEAPPLARLLVTIRAEVLGLTRLEFVRRSGLSRGTVRDLELGVHTPSRRVLRQILTFCQSVRVPAELTEELRRLYLGEARCLGSFLAQLELQAGGARELARRAEISPATLWEYQRGNFPLPWALLEKLCSCVGADAHLAEPLWWGTEVERRRQRGYPDALAEWSVLCERHGLTEKDLLRRGLPTRAVRQLRYLEVPPWSSIEPVARPLCRSQEELHRLESLWQQALRVESTSRAGAVESFGARIGQHRRTCGTSRRELADLFDIGGKKPARILKCIEEDGFYSLQAYPAGLVALLVEDAKEATRLREVWSRRREQFHRRHRPETRIDLRLCREWYGFGPGELEAILGYGRIEYQRLERGVVPLLETARERILTAIEKAGRQRVVGLLQRREQGRIAQTAWKHPSSVAGFIASLAAREGGLIPLARLLREHQVAGLWVDRLRRIVRGEDMPTWFLLEQVGEATGVDDLAEVFVDWGARYREDLASDCPSPLGRELRVLIAQAAPSLRAFSPRLGCNYSVLVRCFHKLDKDEPVRWRQVERILVALGLPRDGDRWRELHALWYTAPERRRRPPVVQRPRAAGQ